MIQDYTRYIKKVGELDRDSDVLTASISSELNQVFYANDLSSELSARDLSVRYVTQEIFHKMINGDPDVSAHFDPKTLYVVSSDEINAYNTNIKNVADPLEAKDAANKRYVDEQLELSTTAKFNSISTYIRDDLNVANSLTSSTKHILTSLTQTAGKISYSAAEINISDVTNLQTTLQNASNALTALSGAMWASLSDLAKHDAPSAMTFNDAVSAIFKFSKVLYKMAGSPKFPEETTSE